MNFRDFIRDIPDFPKTGVIFKDITPLLKDKTAFQACIKSLAQEFQDKKCDYVVAVESRGFIFGAALAYEIGAGFVPVRKKGKLPYKTRSIIYQLEYGTDTLEIHEDALPAGSRVLIVDDVLATGGTLQAVVELIKSQDIEIIGVGFVIELGFLNGRDKLTGLDVKALVKY